MVAMEHPLRKFRALKGLSIEQMAGELGVSVATVSRLENRKQNISIDLARRIKSKIENDVQFADGDLLGSAPERGAAQ